MPGGAAAGRAIAAMPPQTDNAPMPPPLAQPLIDHHDAIVALCRAWGVERLEVFGSAAEGRFDAQRSDFDFIVAFGDDPARTVAERYFGLADALEALLGHRVDLLTSQPIRNPYFRRAVDASRRDLYVQTPAETPG